MERGLRSPERRIGDPTRRLSPRATRRNGRHPNATRAGGRWTLGPDQGAGGTQPSFCQSGSVRQVPVGGWEGSRALAGGLNMIRTICRGAAVAGRCGQGEECHPSLLRTRFHSAWGGYTHRLCLTAIKSALVRSSNHSTRPPGPSNDRTWAGGVMLWRRPPLTGDAPATR